MAWLFLCVSVLVWTACGKPDGGADSTLPVAADPTATAAPAAPLSAAQSIRGKIVGFPQGKKGVRILAGVDMYKLDDPIEVARADAKGLTWAVEPDGSFVLGPLPAGESFSVVAADLHGFSFPVCSDAQLIAVGEQNAELHYQNGANVSFQVIDAETREPLTKFRVISVVGSRQRVESLAPNGRGRNRRHPGGRGTLYDVRPGFDLEWVRLHIECSGYYRLNFPLADWKAGESIDLGVLEMQPVAELNFRVMDRKTGEPLKGARVVLTEVDPTEPLDVDDRGVAPIFLSPRVGNGRELQRVFARTDETGRCQLTPFHARHLELRVSAPLRASYYLRPFELPEESAEFTVALERSVRASIQITDAEGTPRGESWLIRRSPDPHAESSPLFSDDEGWVVLPKAWPGVYRLQALPAPLLTHGVDFGLAWDPWKNYPGPWVELEIPAGDSFEARIALPPTWSVQGSVQRAGQPVSGASVFLSPYPGGLATELIHALLVREGRSYPWLAETDERGRFVIEAVPQGPLYAQVREPHHGWTHFEKIEGASAPPGGAARSELSNQTIELPPNWPPAEPRGQPTSSGAAPLAAPLIEELLNRSPASAPR